MEDKGGFSMEAVHSQERIVKLFGDGEAVDNQGLVYFVYECPLANNPQYAGTYVKAVYFNRTSCASLFFQEVLLEYQDKETETWWQKMQSLT